MLKFIIALGSIAALTACSTLRQSAFPSGWNDETNEAAYIECGAYKINKGYQALVDNGKLTPEQALRASKGDVRTGDSECLAYAAYGLDRKTIGVTTSLEGLVIGKQATYICTNSDVPCPGVRVEFSDGRVTSVIPIR